MMVMMVVVVMEVKTGLHTIIFSVFLHTGITH
jgi:hypothetical protein